ncbi:MAG: cytochrome D1 domain-containing protein [Pseudomonadota bacterium]
MPLKYAVAALALSGVAHADTLIVGNKVEHTVSFIDLATGEEMARRDTGRAPHEVAVSPDGGLAVIVSYREQNYTGNTLHVFDVETAEQIRVIDLGEHLGPHGLKWIPGTREVIATTEVSEDVVIANVDTGEITGSIKTDQQGTHMVTLSPDALRAYTGNIGSGSFSVLDLKTRTKIRDVKAGSQTEAVTVSPDGKEIWVGNNASQSIMIFDSETFEMTKEIRTEGIPIRVEMNPTGEYVAVSFPRLHKVVILDTQSHEQVAEILMQTEGGLVPVTLLWSGDNKYLWAATTGGARVVEIATADWSLRRTLSAGSGSDGLGYSPLDVKVN